LQKTAVKFRFRRPLSGYKSGFGMLNFTPKPSNLNSPEGVPLQKTSIMKTLQFKTTINCGNCVRAVTGFLDDVTGIKAWEVDTDHPDKILTVKGEQLQADAVVEAVEDAGFDIEPQIA
jgi:copper chaperone